MRCAAGCGRKAVHKHHVVTRQRLRAVARSEGMDGWAARWQTLCQDERQLIALCFTCHHEHHSRVGTLDLSLLPDSVFEFAAEVLGGPLAYETLKRSHKGTDSRLDALLNQEDHRVRNAAA